MEIKERQYNKNEVKITSNLFHVRQNFITILSLLGLKKNLSVSDFLPTLLDYMLLKSFFRGLRDFRKNSTKTYVF